MKSFEQFLEGVQYAILVPSDNNGGTAYLDHDSGQVYELSSSSDMLDAGMKGSSVFEKSKTKLDKILKDDPRVPKGAKVIKVKR